MRERDYHICKVEMPMYERYDKAVENNDAEELAWFAQFGTEKWENQKLTGGPPVSGPPVSVRNLSSFYSSTPPSLGVRNWKVV